MSTPSQTWPLAHAGLLCPPTGVVVHVPLAGEPSAAEHTSQGLSHGLSQQKPSDAKPLAHEVPDVAGWPVLRVHAPLELHVLAPEQPPLGSSPLNRVHAPLGAQVRQGPTHELLQHTPPSVAFEHAHAELALQVKGATHPLGSGAFAMGVHAPVEHVRHTPEQALEQQTPSTQCPVLHS